MTQSEKAASLLSELRAVGFSLRVADGKLLVTPGSRLSADQAEAIKAHRDGLLALLAQEVASPVVPGGPFLWGEGPWGFLPRPEVLEAQAEELRTTAAALEAHNQHCREKAGSAGSKSPAAPGASAAGAAPGKSASAGSSATNRPTSPGRRSAACRPAGGPEGGGRMWG